MQNITTFGSLSITRAEPAAAAACLKSIKKAARSKRASLTQHLIYFPKYWEYQDRVFCLLHPEFRNEIEEFYCKDGPTLKEILSENEIRDLDIECEERLRRIPKLDHKVTELSMLLEFYNVKKLPD